MLSITPPNTTAVLPKAALVPPNTASKLPNAALDTPDTAPAGEEDDDDEAAGSICAGAVLGICTCAVVGICAGAVLGICTCAVVGICAGAVLAIDPSAAAPGATPSMCACKNGRASTLGKLGRCDGSFISSDVTT